MKIGIIDVGGVGERWIKIGGEKSGVFYERSEDGVSQFRICGAVPRC